jgi:hypothetical protein
MKNIWKQERKAPHVSISLGMRACVHKYAGDVVIDDHVHHKFKDDAQPGHMIKAVYRECVGEQNWLKGGKRDEQCRA